MITDDQIQCKETWSLLFLYSAACCLIGGITFWVTSGVEEIDSVIDPIADRVAQVRLRVPLSAGRFSASVLRAGAGAGARRNHRAWGPAARAAVEPGCERRCGHRRHGDSGAAGRGGRRGRHCSVRGRELQGWQMRPLFCSEVALAHAPRQQPPSRPELSLRKPPAQSLVCNRRRHVQAVQT